MVGILADLLLSKTHLHAVNEQTQTNLDAVLDKNAFTRDDKKLVNVSEGFFLQNASVNNWHRV